MPSSPDRGVLRHVVLGETIVLAMAGSFRDYLLCYFIIVPNLYLGIYRLLVYSSLIELYGRGNLDLGARGHPTHEGLNRALQI